MIFREFFGNFPGAPTISDKEPNVKEAGEKRRLGNGEDTIYGASHRNNVAP